jgi:hypothetical protein
VRGKRVPLQQSALRERGRPRRPFAVVRDRTSPPNGDLPRR